MIQKNTFQSPSFIPYLTLGDPTLEASETYIRTCLSSGADIVEIGIPFSDPIADGPVIQASHQRALKKQPTLGIDDGLALVERVKKQFKQPLVFMMSSNLLYHYGTTRFFKKAGKAGLDAVILPDVPVEEADPFLEEAKKAKVNLILLVSPLCSDERIKAIAKKSSGFVYLISRTGTTGDKTAVISDLKSVINKLKKYQSAPVCVGFGISTANHLEEVAKIADGGIVGSYLVKLISEAKSIKDADSALAKTVKLFKRALTR